MKPAVLQHNSADLIPRLAERGIQLSRL